MAYDLREDDALLDYQREQLERLLAWFRRNLKIPDKFSSSKSKGSYRRNTKGLSWFKETSLECIAKIRELEALLADCDILVSCEITTKPGYIVYEDEHQIVAEPFASS